MVSLFATPWRLSSSPRFIVSSWMFRAPTTLNGDLAPRPWGSALSVSGDWRTVISTITQHELHRAMLTTQRSIVSVGDLRHIALGECAQVRIDGPRKLVGTHITFGIRLGWRTQERQAHDIAIGGTVLSIASLDEDHWVLTSRTWTH